MTKAKKVFYLCIVILLVINCDKLQSKNNTIRTVINGVIRNMEVYPDSKEFFIQIVDFRGKETIVKDSIKSDGTFKIVFDLYTAQDVKVAPIIGRVIAHPGDSIQLDIDFKDIGHVRFSGDGQKLNQELYKYMNSNYAVFDYKNHNTKDLDLKSYKLICDSIKDEMIQKRNKFIKDLNPTNEIRIWTSNYININYYKSLLIFQLNKHNNVDKSSDDEYSNLLDSVETVINGKLINTDAYEVLDLYTGFTIKKIVQGTSMGRDSAETILMNKLISKYKNGIFRQILIGNYFYQNLNQNDLKYFEKHKQLWDDNIQESFIRIPLENYYQSLKKDIENPKIASDAILSKMNNTKGKAILDSIMIANNGKVIYIDFWATWCGPCKAELPNSKLLQEKLKGEKVEFVYICMDSQEDQWKLVLSQLKLTGSHFLCSTEQARSISAGLGIKAIPFYVLINKQGQISESGNSLRPSNSETILKIDKLLNEK